MGKGGATKDAILARAALPGSQGALSGLSIGRLAEDLHMSKSGLFAHFEAKETLQVEVLERAAQLFVEAIVRPALAPPPGEPRVRALFEHWLCWTKRARLPGGCLFVAAAAELDDRRGPVRDRLVSLQREWLPLIAHKGGAGMPPGRVP